MDHLNRSELGKLLKRRRIELGFKQKELADEFLSPSTISNIELGKRKVSMDTIAYYCKKLSWKLEDIPKYLSEGEKKEEERFEELKLVLQSIENDVDFGNTK
ncbi:helix-turn-helix domain-containing protein [Laceyella tengchongensis]|uniref:helix-turn-helix domain-containing protein n=1 Tax=Laceyella tengchongensis TaxID=574699 RepID=UPI0012B6F6C2|nr:helix-turn-helix domain-containing protein [Laceyella tengchongensis]